MPPWQPFLNEVEATWLVDQLQTGVINAAITSHSSRTRLGLSALSAFRLLLSACATPRGSGDLGVVIERATGSVLVVETTTDTTLARVEGLGDLSHASVVFSRDARYAYVFGRDGGLTKVDLLRGRIDQRVVQAGNAIGGAISQDGRLIAVSNYEPGGVKVFDADHARTARRHSRSLWRQPAFQGRGAGGRAR